MDTLFAVLNPAGRDKPQIFTNGAGSPSDAGHPPVNYHAYAACCRGAFCRDVREIPETVRAVLVLLRKKGLPVALDAIKALKLRNIKVFISWKESGLHQVGDALADARRVASFQEICREADGFRSSTPELVTLYQTSGCVEGEFLPTPYPVEEPSWDFSCRLEERVGIFIGTREFFVPTRNHLHAVTAACSLGVPVTVINTDGSFGERLLRSISADIRIIQKTLPYPEYLRLMARHRVVFQLDRSAVPGQVAGDALLCRIPCVGGDSAVEKVAYPELNGGGRDIETLVKMTSALLEDESSYRAAVVASQATALQTMSFSKISEKILALALGA